MGTEGEVAGGPAGGPGGAVQYSAVQCGAVRCIAVLCCAVQCTAVVQCSTCGEGWWAGPAWSWRARWPPSRARLGRPLTPPWALIRFVLGCKSYLSIQPRQWDDLLKMLVLCRSLSTGDSSGESGSHTVVAPAQGPPPAAAVLPFGRRARPRPAEPGGPWALDWLVRFRAQQYFYC